MHILYDNGVAHMTVYLLAWKACKSVFVLRIELNEITVSKLPSPQKAINGSYP